MWKLLSVSSWSMLRFTSWNWVILGWMDSHFAECFERSEAHNNRNSGFMCLGKTGWQSSTLFGWLLVESVWRFVLENHRNALMCCVMSPYRWTLYEFKLIQVYETKIFQRNEVNINIRFNYNTAFVSPCILLSKTKRSSINSDLRHNSIIVSITHDILWCFVCDTSD